MRKLFLLISVLTLSIVANATTPTITIDGDKSDWAEVPMLSEPGTWPMLKVLPAADAELGTNALAFLLENNEAFTSDWTKYPGTYLDKDYDLETNPYNSDWIYTGMGIDYTFTTGVEINKNWISFPKGKSEDYKAIELGVPSTYISDLGEKFGIGMYYGTGSSQEIWIPKMSGNEISPSIGYLYKTRSYTAIPGTVTAANAYAHQSIKECTDYVDFGLRDNGYDTLRWAAFPIEVTTPGIYSVTTNVSSSNSWKFAFYVVDVASNAIVARLNAPSSDISSSKTSHTFGNLDLSAVPAGKYMLKVQNKTAYSKVKLNSVVLDYKGGKTIDIPETLLPEDAILSPRAWVDKTGAVDSILFTPRGSEGYNLDEWAKWKVNVTTQSYYNFTAHVCRPNGSQKYEIKVLSEDESVEKISNTNESMSSGDRTISTGRVELMPGVYVVKVRNTYKDANSRLLKVVATYEGGNLIDIPATTSLAPADAILSDSAGVVDADPDYINFKVRGSHKYNSTEWAKWRINVTEACSYIFTANVKSTTGQYYTLSVLNSDESETIGEKVKSSDIGSGDKTITTDPIALSEGEYIVKIINPYPNSDGGVKSISVAQATPVTLSEEDLNLEDLTAGATVDIELIRTLVAGMYNTICLPFAVSEAEMGHVFPGAVVKELSSSSIEEGDFVLNLNFSAVSEMEAGKAYLIKPAADIANPKFIGVTIDKTLRPTNTERANFIGNFVAGTIEASEDNLFLGANNTLYFPTTNIAILGMRGYFVVHDVPAHMIKRARIVENNNAVTDIEIVGSQQPKAKSQKLLLDGQLYIMYKGQMYNVQGLRVK